MSSLFGMAIWFGLAVTGIVIGLSLRTRAISARATLLWHGLPPSRTRTWLLALGLLCLPVVMTGCGGGGSKY
jgi:hypothetical protein